MGNKHAINVCYLFITDRIKRGGLRIVHCPTDILIADFYTKPLQGRKFCIFRNLLLNLNEPIRDNYTNAKKCDDKQPISFSLTHQVNCETSVKSQECVEIKMKPTYKDALC